MVFDKKSDFGYPIDVQKYSHMHHLICLIKTFLSSHLSILVEFVDQKENIYLYTFIHYAVYIYKIFILLSIYRYIHQTKNR